MQYNHLSKNWIIFLDILNKYKIPVALGLIGRSFDDNKGDKYNRWFKKLIANHDIFCHGYFHKTDEYKNLIIEEQRDLILRIIKREDKRDFKMPIWSFGVLENKFSERTRRVLKHM